MTLKKFEASDSPKERMLAVINGFGDLPVGADYKAGIGVADGGKPAIIFQFGDGPPLGLLPNEARRLASIMAQGEATDPGAVDGLRDFIAVLNRLAHEADPVEPTVIMGPQVEAAMAADPAMAEAIREFSATARQVMQGISEGKYATFEDGMEALTGKRPQRGTLDKRTGKFVAEED